MCWSCLPIGQVILAFITWECECCISENKNASSYENVTKKCKRIDAISSKLWHCRLGHISRERIERLVKSSILPLLEFSELEQCIDYIKENLLRNKRTIGSIG